MIAEEIEIEIEDIDFETPPPQKAKKSTPKKAAPKKPRKPKTPVVEAVVVDEPVAVEAPAKALLVPELRSCPATWAQVITLDPSGLPRYFTDWEADRYTASGSERVNKKRTPAVFSINAEIPDIVIDDSLNEIVMDKPDFRCRNIMSKARWYRLTLAVIVEALWLSKDHHIAREVTFGNTKENSQGGFLLEFAAQNCTQAAYTAGHIASHSLGYPEGSLAHARFFNAYAQMFGAKLLEGIEPMFDHSPVSGLMDYYKP